MRCSPTGWRQPWSNPPGTTAGSPSAVVQRGQVREVKPFVEWMGKVVQPCNLACDHCYVYELRDRTWRHRPSVMATAAIDQSTG